jgi:transcriptional regulator with PAS, ATPase and Fis domain
MQAKLVRVVETLEVQPLGTSEPQRLDLRLIAATKRDLRKMVAAGEFRSDLYYRLDVGSIRVPALREHIEDVEALTAHFIGHYNRAFGKRIVRISRPTLDLLNSHEWPGNVRELVHVIERATLISDNDCIDLCDLPMDLLATVTVQEPATVEGPQCAPADYNSRERSAANAHCKRMPLDNAMRAVVLRALEQAHGDCAEAAKLLGIARAALYRKMARFGITREWRRTHCHESKTGLAPACG